MNPTPFIIAAMALALIGYALGLYEGRMNKHPITEEAINKYIEEKFPDLWGAYKQGVHEGYEQGLRDGQELPNEST